MINQNVFTRKAGDFMRTNYNISEISDLVAPVAAKYGVNKVYLFGSRARGTSNENSDYDFMISKGALRGLQFMDFIFDLEDIFKTHIDVILDTDKTCYALDSAIKDGILIYERQ